MNTLEAEIILDEKEQATKKYRDQLMAKVNEINEKLGRQDVQV